MRLINCESFELEEFFGSDIPDYAILSHTWGDEEVTFSGLPLHQPPTTTRSGHRKIMHTCKQALRDGLSYAWVDTCCIDKTSSTELSEAINSMYAWYRDSTRCYAILEDVSLLRFQTEFSFSRWFTRGWTLQELIAPPGVIFYDKDWTQLGTRQDLAAWVSKITSIDEMVLYHGITTSGSRHKPPMQAPRLDQFCIAKRMAWASLRETTREEDTAYCLLGIFELNMPLLYGEGRRAFIRLQEELMRQTDDDSILAWGLDVQYQPLAVFSSLRPSQGFSDLLAASPKSFRYCRDLERTIGSIVPFSKSNVGLHIQLPTLPVMISSQKAVKVGFIGLLSCARSMTNKSTRRQMLGIFLFPLDSTVSGAPNRRMARLAYRKNGIDWATVIVDVGDLIRSSIEAIIIVSNHRPLSHIEGLFREQNQREKNECFRFNVSSVLESMGYSFTHAKSWLSYDRVRSIPREAIELKSGSYTFVNHNFSTNVLFMTFEDLSGIRHKAFTVAVDLYSGHTGVWDVSLRNIDDDNLISYSWLANQGPTLCCYAKGKIVTYYHSDPFSITVKLLKAKIAHEWRIREIDIQADIKNNINVQQTLPNVEMPESGSRLATDPQVQYNDGQEKSTRHSSSD